jgi:GTPase SAR1 family protein
MGAVSIVLAGNKCDSDEKRVVTKAMGERLALSKGIPFFETSAKNDTNINEVPLGRINCEQTCDI